MVKVMIQILRLKISKAHLCNVKLKFSLRPSIRIRNMSILDSFPLVTPFGDGVRPGGSRDQV